MTDHMKPSNEVSERLANLSPVKLALLERRLKDRQKIDAPRRQDTPRHTPMPLSFSQQRLWVLNQLDPNSPVYNIAKAVRISGPLQIAVLQRALEAIVARHAPLHTTFTVIDDNPRQIVSENWSFELPVMDLSLLSEGDKTIEVQRILSQQTRQPFSLAADLMLRANLFQLAQNSRILLLVIHHIAFDGWSMGILFRELSALYGAFSVEEPSPLSELPIQYTDFAVWQRAQLEGEFLENLLVYWKGQLNDAPSILELPADHPRSSMKTSVGRREAFELPTALHGTLKVLSQQAAATLFMTVLAAFDILLYRYTAQAHIVVGTPIANRTRVELEGLIGFFVNTLIIHTDLSGNPTFRDLLARVREVTLGAYTHQDLPFEKLVEALQLMRDRDSNPLFQVMFSFQDASNRTLTLPGLTVSDVPQEIGTEQFDLTLSIAETPTGLNGALTYNAGLFETTTIKRMVGHFQRLLEGIVADPEMPIEQLPLLTEAEEHQLLVAWNKTAAPRDQKQGIHHLFEAQAARTPEAVAVIAGDQDGDGQTVLTYGELNARANQLARVLQKRGVGPDVLVGIYAERSLEMVVGLMAILKAGGAYVPLDPAYPTARLAFMAEDAQISLLLTQSSLLEILPHCSAQIIALDSDWPLIAQESRADVVSKGRGDNVAYVMYTSGSSGKPKGVLVPHRGACNYLLWRKTHFPLMPSDRLLQKTSSSFDDSVWELFEPLMVGAQLIMAAPNRHRDPAYLVQFIMEQEITAVGFVPSLLDLFLEEPGVKKCTSLRRVTTGGETVLTDLQECFFARLKADLYNLYGPTEASIASTCWTCQRSGQVSNVPIGSPIANTQIYILDPHRQPVPIGVPGEIYIAGMGLANGYLNRPMLTAEKFIADAFSADLGTRLYKTGDLARYLPDGNIEFLGRIDQQVKLRGYRIELGEVEAFLQQHPTVQKAVAIIREDQPGDKHLVAYVVPEPEPAPAAGELRRFLKEKLPEYMVPSVFVMLGQLPLMPNGKVDRRALPGPDTTGPDLEETFVAPRTPVEEKIAAIWSEVLQLQRVGVFDNFFELGGHSLLAAQVISRVRRTFEIDPPLRTLFEAPTIAGLAEILDTMHWATRSAGAGPLTSRDDVGEATF